MARRARVLSRGTIPCCSGFRRPFRRTELKLSIENGPESPPEVTTYLPETLDLSLIVPPKWHDYAAWVVGGLYLRRHTEKYADPDDFRRTSSTILKQVLPKRDYAAILALLIDGGVVERNDSYRVGTRGRPGRCKGYRLTAKYRENHFRRVRLPHHELRWKVARIRAREDALIATDVHHHLRQSLSRLELTADAPDALPLARIRDRGFWLTVCAYGRVHTNLTNLGEDLRQYLRVGGRPLWGVDIVNSQPLLLGLTLAAENGFRSTDLQLYRAWLENPTNPLPNLTPSTPPIPYLGPYGTGLNERQDDVGEFIRLCLEGGIYERLMSLTGLSRSEVKDEFFGVAFGRPWLRAHTPFGAAFRREFPSCWEGMCRLKADDHAELARQMQMVESYVVIRRTCARLATAFPDAPLLTLHDSLVSDEAHIEEFGRVLVSEFRATFGVEPRVKTKPFLDVELASPVGRLTHGLDVPVSTGEPVSAA